MPDRHLQMPGTLKGWASGKSGPVIFIILLLAVFGLNFTGNLSAIATWASLFLLACLSMIVREWVLFDDRQLTTPIERQYRRLVAGLDRATSQSHAEYTESIEQIWYVESSGQDRGRILYETAVLGTDSMAWRRVKLFPTSGVATPTVEQMKFECAETAGGAGTEAFRVKDGPTADYLVIFNTPVVGAAPRSWSVEYVWPGLWNPLRETGEDHGVVELSEDAPTASIRLVFPTGTEVSNNRFVRRQPDVGAERFELFDGRPSLVWEIGPCSAGDKYRADVRVNPATMRA